MNTGRNFSELSDEVRVRDDYWVEHAKLSFSLGLGDLFDRAQINKADFSKRIGKSPAYVSKIFRGDVNFTIETMVKLVRALGGRLHLKVAPHNERYAFVPAYPVDEVSVTAEGFIQGLAWTGHPNLVGMPASPRLMSQNDENYEFESAA